MVSSPHHQQLVWEPSLPEAAWSPTARYYCSFLETEIGAIRAKKKKKKNSRCTSPLPGSHWMLVFHFQFSPYTGWLFKIKITMLAILNC